ncbi:MAG TPA: tetratricopeptide repeat protein [Oscillatoriaceae cyanobacterium M33_DOE_052]|uniref:Tetratricopeptide repeat protein n=1 Tax=Planktothricoides sp. SpSt-374 TaxID=2282167 RepID=A0A7C3VKP2_9CYAN|nr:tetratricopeptide repeat protein [Oscillatoriaceae cyanobacterium M33_DOE_052]
MLRLLWQRVKRIVQQLWQYLRGWLNPEPNPSVPPPPLADSDVEYLFETLLSGVSKGWNQSQVLQWLRQQEYRLTESQWLAWLDRYRLTYTPTPEMQQSLLRLAQLGCGQISQIAAQLASIPPIDDRSEPFRRQDSQTPEVATSPPHTLTLDNPNSFPPSPENPENLVILGEDEQQYLDFLAQLERATKEDPDNSQLWTAIGELMGILERDEEALAAFDRALAIAPAIASTWYNRGNALYNLHRYAEAVTSYTKALELQPDYPEAEINRRSAQTLEMPEIPPSAAIDEPTDAQSEKSEK